MPPAAQGPSELLSPRCPGAPRVGRPFASCRPPRAVAVGPFPPSVLDVLDRTRPRRCSTHTRARRPLPKARGQGRSTARVGGSTCTVSVCALGAPGSPTVLPTSGAVLRPGAPPCLVTARGPQQPHRCWASGTRRASGRPACCFPSCSLPGRASSCSAPRMPFLASATSLRLIRLRPALPVGPVGRGAACWLPVLAGT